MSTNVDAVSEVIIDGHNGFLLKSGDVNKMLDKISKLLCDDVVCESFCENAYETAKSMFDMDKMIDSYENLIINVGIS